MTVAATHWAMTAPVETPAERLLLILFGDIIDCDGNSVMSWVELKRKSTMERDDALNVLRSLEADGFLGLRLNTASVQVRLNVPRGTY